MSWASQIYKLSRQLDGGSSWALAFILLGAAVATRVLLQPWTESLTFLTFIPAVAVVTLLCGWLQATVVLILSALVVWRYFLPPIGSFTLSDASMIVWIVGFIAAGGCLILLISGLLELIQRLERSERIKESLFRELQHRVANNLTIVVAILRNARRGLHRRETAIEALTDAEDRITAMAEMHRRLHDVTSLASGLEPLLREVLREAFREIPVKVHLSVEKDLSLTLDRSTAIVLLVNEAAINAAKHVFRKGLGASFDVLLKQLPNGLLELKICDDGPGMSSTLVIDQSASSLGLGIMQAFARQLGGTLQVSAGPGTAFSVVFAVRENPRQWP